MADTPDHVSPNVRRARPADARAMFELAQRAYTPYLDRMDVRPGPMDADYRVAVERSEAWVVDEPDGRIVALLVLLPAADHLLLENMAVDPDVQGRGIGRMLMRLTEDRARSLGLDEVRLYTHVTMTENQRIYESHGYVETNRTATDEFRRVHYTKRLSD